MLYKYWTITGTYFESNTYIDVKNICCLEMEYGTKMWFKDGKRHREDGPAIEWHSGRNEWFLYGKPIIEEEFNSITDSIQRKLIWG
jgi:hypothetical protein